MFATIQEINTRACGDTRTVVFDGYVNGDIVFTQVRACKLCVSVLCDGVSGCVMTDVSAGFVAYPRRCHARVEAKHGPQ